MKWRDVRGIINAALRATVVRVVLGLLAALGGAEVATDEPVVDELKQFASNSLSGTPAIRRPD